MTMQPLGTPASWWIHESRYPLHVRPRAWPTRLTYARFCREEGVAQTRPYALIGIFAHNLESRLEAAMIGNLMSSHS